MNKMQQEDTPPSIIKKSVSLEAFVFLAVFGMFFYMASSKMGCVNFLNTLMNTAYSLLLETVFYIMAIAVLAGAVSGLFSEFGIIALMNKILSPLMRPIYDLPGASAIGILTCYLSDNPAILTLANDDGFRRCYKKYQLPALTNIGTSFGMGLIITTFMVGLAAPGGESFGTAVLVGNLAAVLGSVVSTRIMLVFTAREYGKDEMCSVSDPQAQALSLDFRMTRSGSVPSRVMESMLDGGKSGVELGLAIIPGVLIICTLVMILTNNPSATGLYTGAAYEGVSFFPWIGEKLDFILTPLFGFSDTSAIAIPFTALGAAGAAIGLIPKMLADGLIHANDIAVFTAMCMCWSGYLSTHVAMMSSLGCRKLTGKAIFSHTIGGFSAGIFAHWIFRLITLL